MRVPLRGILLSALVALALLPLHVHHAFAQGVEEDLETLEAEKFDDEFADENFEGINDREFEDIIEGEASISEEEITLEDAPPAEDLLEELPPAEGSEDALADEEPALEEPPMAEQPQIAPPASPPIEDMPTAETPALSEELPPVEEGMQAAEPPMMGEELPQEMIETMPSDPAMGAMDAPPPSMVQTPVYDAPDEAFENRLHDIFENYNKIPISNEQWAEIAGQKTKEVYSVIRGDSLWEISEMFFGDGNFWPKVWSFNSSITNPHMIDIGDRIMFYPGDEENPPQVVVEPQAPPAVAEMPPAEMMPSPEPMVAEGAQEVYTDDGDVLDIPQPTAVYPPPLQQIPPSLPEEKPLFYEGFDETGFAVSNKRFSKSEVADMKLTSFVAESYPEGDGEVVEMMGGKPAAQLHEYVYVRMQNGAPGDVYTVISKARRGAGDKNIEFSNGVAVQYQGEIELRDVVNEDINLYRALVTFLVDQITIGAKVVEGRIPTVSVSNVGASSDLKAKIIGGEFDVGRTALGVGSVVFLDAGSEAGFQPDMIVGVVANEKIRNEKTKIAVNLREIGRIKVAKVEPTVSTGIVVYASEEITTGDFVGRTVASAGGLGSELGDFGGAETYEDEGEFADDLGVDDLGEEPAGDLGVPGEPSEFEDEELGDDFSDLGAGGDELGGEDEFAEDFGGDLSAGGEAEDPVEIGGDLGAEGEFGADLGEEGGLGGELEDDLGGGSDIEFGDEFSESEEGGDDFNDEDLSL